MLIGMSSGNLETDDELAIVEVSEQGFASMREKESALGFRRDGLEGKVNLCEKGIKKILKKNLKK